MYNDGGGRDNDDDNNSDDDGDIADETDTDTIDVSTPTHILGRSSFKMMRIVLRSIREDDPPSPRRLQPHDSPLGRDLLLRDFDISHAYE